MGHRMDELLGDEDQNGNQFQDLLGNGSLMGMSASSVCGNADWVGCTCLCASYAVTSLLLRTLGIVVPCFPGVGKLFHYRKITNPINLENATGFTRLGAQLRGSRLVVSCSSA